jgi:hypothetical protein
MNLYEIIEGAVDWADRADEWVSLPSNRKHRKAVKEMTKEMRVAVDHLNKVMQMYNAAPTEVDLYDYENQPDS